MNSAEATIQDEELEETDTVRALFPTLPCLPSTHNGGKKGHMGDQVKDGGKKVLSTQKRGKHVVADTQKHRET